MILYILHVLYLQYLNKMSILSHTIMRYVIHVLIMIKLIFHCNKTLFYLYTDIYTNFDK